MNSAPGRARVSVILVRVLDALRTGGGRGGFGRTGTSGDENRYQGQEHHCNQVLLHCAKETHAAHDVDVLMLRNENPAAFATKRVLLSMKPICLAVLAGFALGLAGCVTETTKTRTVQNQTDPTTTRVHTQEELRKSGESQAGPALSKTDAAITTSGPR